MNVAGQVVHQIAEKMEVDSRIFCVKEFASCFKQTFFNSRNAPVTKSGLAAFFRTRCRIMGQSSAPVFRYMHGAYKFVQSEPVPAAETPARKKRSRLVVSPTKTQASVIRSEESLQKVDKDKTVIEVENLQTRIEQMFADNGQKPIPYLSIIVDRADYGKTVENVFHFSFLVKEGYQKIVMYKGISSVEPVEEEVRKELRQNGECRQVIFSFSQKDWEEWRQKVKKPEYRIG
jgi:hypothetical protein